MPNISPSELSALQFPWTTELCQAAAPIYVNITINNQDARDLGIRGVVGFLQLLPFPFNESTEGMLCEWWTTSWSSASAIANMAFVESINMSCNSEVCADVDWGGNPDIGGIGVSALCMNF